IAWGPRPALRVLFLCSGNSARSILAEAILNLKNASLEGRRVRGHSAGSQPTGSVEPGALELLGDRTYRLDRLHSKSWDTFTSDSAPPIDWVITLCDSAARETCQTFAGEGRRLHWGLPDPVGGAASFVDTYQAIEEYITAFLEELGADQNHSP
ncbi:MAG: arsenate reductase ArsC, partial [Pseudomonadales bacterium]